MSELKPFKILVIHCRYKISGGEDSVFESECKMLADAGHSVVKYEASNKGLDENCGLPGKFLMFVNTVWNRAAYRSVRERICTLRPDVVHCHNTFPSLSPSVYYAAADEGVPVVQTLHNYRVGCLNGFLFREGGVCERCVGRIPWRGCALRCYRNSFAASSAVGTMLMFHRMIGTFSKRVSAYIALTEAGRRKFIDLGIPAGKIHVKPNVVPGAAMKIPFAERSNVVLCVSRLSPEKGVHVLIEGWRNFVADRGFVVSGSDMPKLKIVGSGPEEASLRELARGIAGVEFAGQVPHDELLGEISRCKAVIQPSICYETFGLAVVEAASAGVPAIVADIGGLSSLVENGVSGILFEAGNTSGLSDALCRAFADPTILERMGEKAYGRYVSGFYAPEKNVRLLEKIYGEAVSGLAGVPCRPKLAKV